MRNCMRQALLRSVSVMALMCATLAFAQPTKQKTNPTDARRPGPSITIPAADFAELRRGADELDKAITNCARELTDAKLVDLLPDVRVLHKAVDWALRYGEFIEIKDVAAAKALLKLGNERVAELKAGKPSWPSATGLVVRGYFSQIDGSVQPYGLVVPPDFKPTDQPRRLDLWWHGRDEKLTELRFLADRLKSPGEFTPKGAFVLHPYGRFCNANKFAGELDSIEAITLVQRQYPIDDNRMVARGFSMGGAACWQFTTHYPSFWCAAAPGAGFAETPEFTRAYTDPKAKPRWFEEKLWHQYNATDYAVNLTQLPTVAYSGEIDKQRQAADVMAMAMSKEGLNLVHLIGPETAHKYHPETKKEIDKRIDEIVEKGRDPNPGRIKFTTWTLRYCRCAWLAIRGLERHWERARVEGTPTDLTTSNVSQLSIVGDMMVARTIDGQKLPADAKGIGRYVKDGGKWRHWTDKDEGFLRKRPNLHGPIDDAFMGPSPFLVVKPTGKPLHPAIAAWSTKECDRFIEHWRRHFRGDAKVMKDTEVTQEDIETHHLILWGDRGSNSLIGKIADRLPIDWGSETVLVDSQKFPAASHVPVMIYPNPLNNKKYIVLNSGFTFRDFDYLNNARQVPKLPDYAIVDVRTPPNDRWPGKVVTAGFFTEFWKLPERLPPAE